MDDEMDALRARLDAAERLVDAAFGEALFASALAEALVTTWSNTGLLSREQVSEDIIGRSLAFLEVQQRTPAEAAGPERPRWTPAAIEVARARCETLRELFDRSTVRSAGRRPPGPRGA